MLMVGNHWFSWRSIFIEKNRYFGFLLVSNDWIDTEYLSSSPFPGRSRYVPLESSPYTLKSEETKATVVAGLCFRNFILPKELLFHANLSLLEVQVTVGTVRALDRPHRVVSVCFRMIHKWAILNIFSRRLPSVSTKMLSSSSSSLLVELGWGTTIRQDSSDRVSGTYRCVIIEYSSLC